MVHTQLCQSVCEQALKILDARELKFRPMKRKSYVNSNRSYVIGRTNLKTKLITIDIYTPKRRQPKKISSILRILCHEVAHHQKPPFRERYRRRTITRQHYPAFYKQVNRNVAKLKGNQELSELFE